MPGVAAQCAKAAYDYRDAGNAVCIGGNLVLIGQNVRSLSGRVTWAEKAFGLPDVVLKKDYCDICIV